MLDNLFELTPVHVKSAVGKYIRSDRQNFQGVKLEEIRENYAVIADRVVDTLNQQLHMGPNNRPVDTKARKADAAFVQAVDELIKNDEISPIERRILGSDLGLLHYLLAGNGKILEDAYQMFLTRETRNTSSITLDEEIQIKSDIAFECIKKQQQKNLELPIANKFPKAPTVGFEFEFPDILDIASEILKEKKEEIAHLEQIDTDDQTLREKKAMYNWIVASLHDLQEVKSDPIDALRFLSFVVPTRVGRLENLDQREEKVEIGGAKEYVQSPTMSPRATLRELIILAKMGLMQGELTVHETISGIELKPGQTNYMEARPLLALAGYGNNKQILIKSILSNQELYKKLGMPITDEELSALKRGNLLPQTKEKLFYFVKKGGLIAREYISKQSTVDGRSMKFPLHRLRTDESLDKLKKEPVLKPFPYDLPNSAVEVRSFEPFELNNVSDFINLVRRSNFFWHTAWGEQANVIPQQNRSDFQDEFSAAWRRCLWNYGELRKQFEIQHPDQEHMYLTNELNLDGQFNYNNYLSECIVMSELFPQVRSEARRNQLPPPKVAV